MNCKHCHYEIIEAFVVDDQGEPIYVHLANDDVFCLDDDFQIAEPEDEGD